jgi:DNA-binding response OmpR family regulator
MGGKMKKILICEDEQDIRESLLKILSRSEYEVQTCENGQEAIAKTREFKPNLILLDVRMPKIDGLEVAKEVRKFDKLVKIIFVTAFASEEIRKEATRYDIADYLVKPIPPEIIIQKIEQSLEK